MQTLAEITHKQSERERERGASTHAYTQRGDNQVPYGFPLHISKIGRSSEIVNSRHINQTLNKRWRDGQVF